MGYKIIYNKKAIKKGNGLRVQTMTACFALLFVLTVKASWPEAADFLQEILVSEELSRRAQAMTAMVRELEHGEAVSEAVEVFCQEILGGK